MKRHIFLMMLIMVWNVVEAMLKFGEGWEGSGGYHNPLRSAIKLYPKHTMALTWLQEGADPNEADWVDTPLGNASSKGQVELMLSYGADPKKMKGSGLAKVITHYFCLKKDYKPLDISDEQWRSEAFEAMDLLLKHGESINKRGHGGHLMTGLFNFLSQISDNDRKPLLSFLIARGSNPNKLDLWSPDFEFHSHNSIYQIAHKENSELEQFMRKERGWYLTWPLFLITHISKKTDGDGTEVWDYKQPSKCVMRGLPRDLVREIAKYLLNWKQ